MKYQLFNLNVGISSDPLLGFISIRNWGLVKNALFHFYIKNFDIHFIAGI
jgi:hypothetical protein